MVSTGRGDDPATFAVVLYLDEHTESRIREIWAHLDARGVPSVETDHGPSYRPHLTLAMIETSDATRVAESLHDPLAGVAGLPVTLASLGFFMTEVAPAYLAVTPTSRLLRLHEEVHAALRETATWAYYCPGTWVPHCTLAMGVTCPEVVNEVVDEAALPLHATITSAHVVQLRRREDTAIPSQRNADHTVYPAEARHRAGPRHRGGRRIAPSLIWR
jgi:2'-5' RNA ligase